MVRLRLPLLLAALIASISPVVAKNLPDPKSGCQLIVPDDWSVISPPAASDAYTVEAVKSDHSKAVLLYVGSVSNAASIDDNSSLIKGIEDGFQKSGGKIISRDHQKLHDITFYVMTGTIDNGKSVIQTTMWVTVATGHMYEVGLYDFGGDPAKDLELIAALNSFSLSVK